MPDQALASRFAPDGFFRMSAFEAATGWVPGFEQIGADLAPPSSLGARAAFEAVVRRSLLRPPCVVAFSGGRDSSAVLAVAKQVADRDGLDPPIAATHVFTDDLGSDESTWQELVIDHLGIDDWERVPADDSFDILGEPARSGLRRHGALWPALAHCHAPLTRLARGGTVLTGVGGDEVMGPQRVTALVVAARRRPSRAVARGVAASLAPAPVRRRLAARRHVRWSPRPWLRPHVNAELVRRLAADDASHPLRWDTSVRRWARQRAAVLSLHNMAAVAREDDVTYDQPFLDPTFVDRLAAQGGRFGYSGRTQMMEMLFADVLPPDLLSRQTKAYFNAVAVGPSSREFARNWSGGGVDLDLVDPEGLRDAWLAPLPHMGSMCLLQEAWLAEQAA